MYDVCVVGSVNLDLVATVERLPGPGETVAGSAYHEYAGGKGLNQAVAVARAGASCALVGAVGDDAAGTGLLRVMGQEGIDTAGVAVVGAPTGRALIGVAASGENSIIVVAGANATVHDPVVPASRVVLSQLEVPIDAIETAFSAARAMGATTVLNPAPARSLPESLLSLCDVVVPNEHERSELGDVSPVRTLVVTEGERGALVVSNGSSRRIDPYRVEAVDTVAAGDAFCGALAAALSHGATLDDALDRACAAGALATLTAGAVPSLPTDAAISRLVSGGR